MTSDVLLSRIASVRAKHVAVAACTGAALAIALVVAWTGITMWIDWNVTRGLPLWGRALSLALELVAVAAIIAYFVVRPILRKPDDESVALMIEHEWPDFKSRFIASVQLTQPAALAEVAAAGGNGRSLVSAMVRQAEELADQTPLNDVIKTKNLNKTAGAAAVLILLAVFLFLLGLPATAALLNRAMLGSAVLPTKTHFVDFDTHDIHIAIGDPLKIQVKVTGYKPSSGTLEVTYAGGRVQHFPISRDSNTADTYSTTLESVQESFKYSVVIYDAGSDDRSVLAMERPAVASFDCWQIYPAYTGLGTVHCDSSALSLLTGSKLQVRVLSTKPVRSGTTDSGQSNYILCFSDNRTRSVSEGPNNAETQSANSESKILLYRNPKNLRELTADVPLPPNLNALSVHLVDTDDLESKDTAVYPVEMLIDRPPTIKITSPDRKEVLETAIAKLEVGFLAEDDYMVGPITLRYKVDENPTIHDIKLDVPPNQHDPLKAKYLWDISKIPAPVGQPSLEGSVLEYWMEVSDTRTKEFGGPNHGASEHYSVRVVSAAAKLAELNARSGQAVEPIKDAHERQDENAHNTDTIIKEMPGGVSPTPSPPPP